MNCKPNNESQAKGLAAVASLTVAGGRLPTLRFLLMLVAILGQPLIQASLLGKEAEAGGLGHQEH